MWMRKMLKDIGIDFIEPIVICSDNTITVSMSNNPILHSNKKNISIKYHVLREKVEEKEILLENVSTKD